MKKLWKSNNDNEDLSSNFCVQANLYFVELSLIGKVNRIGAGKKPPEVFYYQQFNYAVIDA